MKNVGVVNINKFMIHLIAINQNEVPEIESSDEEFENVLHGNEASTVPLEDFISKVLSRVDDPSLCIETPEMDLHFFHQLATEKENATQEFLEFFVLDPSYVLFKENEPPEMELNFLSPSLFLEQDSDLNLNYDNEAPEMELPDEIIPDVLQQSTTPEMELYLSEIIDGIIDDIIERSVRKDVKKAKKKVRFYLPELDLQNVG